MLVNLLVFLMSCCQAKMVESFLLGYVPATVSLYCAFSETSQRIEPGQVLSWEFRRSVLSSCGLMKAKSYRIECSHNESKKP